MCQQRRLSTAAISHQHQYLLDLSLGLNFLLFDWHGGVAEEPIHEQSSPGLNSDLYIDLNPVLKLTQFNSSAAGLFRDIRKPRINYL